MGECGVCPHQAFISSNILHNDVALCIVVCTPPPPKEMTKANYLFQSNAISTNFVNFESNFSTLVLSFIFEKKKLILFLFSLKVTISLVEYSVCHLFGVKEVLT